MSKKILSVLLAVFLAVGFASFVTKADVTGSFAIRVEIFPLECGALPFVTISPTPSLPVNCEATLQKSDVETALTINWFISGLTLTLHSHAGFTGLEDVILTLNATLGALGLTDQFVFAVPFGRDDLVIHNANFTQTHTQKVFTVINPGNLLFVKKQVLARISIAGITLSNLGVFEDVTFPSPTAPQPAAYPAASQTFAFGDTLIISGQTVSGITVTNTVGIGMDPQKSNKIKKHTLTVGGLGGLVCNQKTLGFVVEKIAVLGVPVGPVTLNENLKFVLGQPSPCSTSTSPFSATTSVSFNSPLGAISATLTTTDITQQLFSSASLTIASGGVTITESFTSTLQLGSLTATLATTLNPEGNSPAALTISTTVCQNAAAGCTVGLNNINLDLAVTRTGVTFDTNIDFSGTGTVVLDGLTFTLAAVAGAVNLSATVTVIPAWDGVFTASVTF